MPKITHHQRRAEVASDHAPAVVLATAADLALLPRWWFAPDEAEGHPAVDVAIRTVSPVEGGGLVADGPGAEVLVHSDGSSFTMKGLGTRQVDEPRTYRFRCVELDPGRRIVLGSAYEEETMGFGTVATEIDVETDGDGSLVRILQRTIVTGRGMGARLARAVHDRADDAARQTAERLLALVPADAAAGGGVGAGAGAPPD